MKSFPSTEIQFGLLIAEFAKNILKMATTNGVQSIFSPV